MSSLLCALFRFIWFVSWRVAFAKSNEKNVSHFIVRIGQLAVGLGVAISLITVAVGIGSQTTIKNKLAIFTGHYVLRSFDSNNSYNSSPLDTSTVDWKSLSNYSTIQHIQTFATLTGVIRTTDTFEGIVFKGYGTNFLKDNFKEILINGRLPNLTSPFPCEETILSEKIAKALNLNVNDYYQIYFINPSGRPIYRKFKVCGIYRTCIKMIDDSYVVGDVRHIQRINKWNNSTIGGIEIFLVNPKLIDKEYETISTFCGYNHRLEKLSDIFSSLIHWVELFDINIMIILIIMSVVVSMNIIMIFLILVIEKVRLIGVLKTLGISDKTLRILFMVHSMWIMFPGILGGNIFAFTLLLMQKEFEFIRLDPDNYYMSVVPVHLDWDYPLLISVGALLIVWIVLALPSMLLNKITPTQFLKFD